MDRQIKLLVCGTQMKFDYSKQVKDELDKLFSKLTPSVRQEYPLHLIHGGCPDSADVYAQAWAASKNIPITRYSSNAGHYLKRNIEMVKDADYVLAFYDGFSYGTAHTVINALMKGIEVDVYPIIKKYPETFKSKEVGWSNDKREKAEETKH